MFYAEPMIRGNDARMWAVVQHTGKGLIVETIIGSKRYRGAVSPFDAVAYRNGKLGSVRIYSMQEVSA